MVPLSRHLDSKMKDRSHSETWSLPKVPLIGGLQEGDEKQGPQYAEAKQAWKPSECPQTHAGSWTSDVSDSCSFAQKSLPSEEQTQFYSGHHYKQIHTRLSLLTGVSCLSMTAPNCSIIPRSRHCLCVSSTFYTLWPVRMRQNIRHVSPEWSLAVPDRTSDKAREIRVPATNPSTKAREGGISGLL